MAKSCPTCYSSGVIRGNERCPRCNGTGVIKPKVGENKQLRSSKIRESSAGQIISNMNKFARNGMVEEVTECFKQLKPYTNKLTENAKLEIKKAFSIVKRNAK